MPEIRLKGDYAGLKADNWFDDFDWDKLYNREMKVPYIPPNDKIVGKEEIKKMAAKNIDIIKQIKEDQSK